MDNREFWKSYKAKCAEKGLKNPYANEEEFSKAMNESPKPFSADDIVAKRDIEGWHALEEGVDDIDVGDIEEPVIEDTQTQKEEGVKHVPWIRCEACEEMKEETSFSHVRGGGFQKVCKECMAKKIRGGHKKNEKPKDEPTEPIEAIDLAKVNLDDEKDALPLLKEGTTLKSMSEETLRAMIIMAYQLGLEHKALHDEITLEHGQLLVTQIVTGLEGVRA